MTPDENWLARLPLIKDAIGVPITPIRPDTDYLWAILTALPGYARICFTYDGMENRATSFIEMQPGMNSITVNTGQLIDATIGFDVTKTELVYIGGYQFFAYTALFLGKEHCLTHMRLKPPAVNPLLGML